MRPPLTCLLFDLDGTLVDSMSLIYASFRHTMREVLELAPSDEALLGIFGQPLVKGLATLGGLPLDLPASLAANSHLPPVYDPGEPPEQRLMRRLLYVYRTHNLSHHDDYIKCFPGANETLNELKRRGYALGVVTSKGQLTAVRSTARCGLDVHMDTMVVLEDTGKHKPDPTPLLLALRRPGRRPEESLYLGDAAVDVLAARAAGTVAAAALWGPLPREQVLALAPDYALESIGELLQLCPRLAV
ncbi:MAG: HAD-IA family hydrolase [Chloroflexi bacterium]|nr:HAD-IA family hydrolase [Chloroflexota bacterium]